MTDRVLDEIRRIDPCPGEVAPPPLDQVRARLTDERPASEVPTHRPRRPRAGLIAGAFSAAVAAAVAVVALVLIGHHDHRPAPAGRPTTGLLGACHPEVSDAVLPPWARAGFSERRPRIPHELGRSGRILAIVWGRLDSPPSPDRANKINWVSHVRDVPGRSLHIDAQRMDGATPVGAPVRRLVRGGPAPSIINLPAPGCWRLTLRWSGHTDRLDLHYGAGGH